MIHLLRRAGQSNKRSTGNATDGDPAYRGKVSARRAALIQRLPRKGNAKRNQDGRIGGLRVFSRRRRPNCDLSHRRMPGRRLYERAEGETASSRVGHVSHRECRYQSEERKSSPHLKSILQQIAETSRQHQTTRLSRQTMDRRNPHGPIHCG